MAIQTLNIESVLEAHQIRINGCSELPPSVEEATVTLEQASAALSVSIYALEEGVLNDDIITNAFKAAQTLVDHGIRQCIVGYRRMSLQ